jgi:hypothetical protein
VDDVINASVRGMFYRRGPSVTFELIVVPSVDHHNHEAVSSIIGTSHQNTFTAGEALSEDNLMDVDNEPLQNYVDNEEFY